MHLKKYKVGDFTGWEEEVKFNAALNKLVAALKADRELDIPPSMY